jgi:hypothetical protein
MPTLLAKKSDPTVDNAVATDDDHHEALANDSTVNTFPQGSSFGSTGGSNAFTNSSSNSSTFGSSSSGFGSTSTFGSPATGTGSFGSSSGFGSTAGGFGSSTTGSTLGQNQTPVNNNSANLQSTGGAMQEGGTTTLKTDDKFGNFINSKWRPMMAFIYMITCACDFVVFPILWSLLQALSHGNVTSQWMPLTLQGAGLYHIAMGAVLGIAAYGRSQEKLAGKS